MTDDFGVQVRFQPRDLFHDQMRRTALTRSARHQVRRPDPLEEQADERLADALAAAREGDEQAFVTLWRTLQPPLLRYLAVRGAESPDDVAAETWLQVVRDLASFTGGIDDFRGWLFTVARHRAIDEARARGSRPVVLSPEPLPSLAEVASSAEDAALERMSTAAALALVASLPAAQAELVMLRVVAGLDVATVAQIVGKQPGAVRVAVHRALHTLARDAHTRSAQEVG